MDSSSAASWSGPLACVLAAPLLAPALAPPLLAQDAPASASASTPAAAAPERLESYRAHIGAAEACLRLEEAAAAAQWLDGAPVDLRGWEWGWLAARCDESLRTLQAHEDVAFGLRLSADGKRLASAGYDRTARLWDAATGELQVTLSGHTEGLWAAVFTPDGRQVLTASADRTARLWDAATGVPLTTLWRHDYPISCVDVSPDGSTFAASAYTLRQDPSGIVGLVKLFDAGTHEELATLQAGNKPISLIRFSPDGKRLAAASWDSNVHVWDVASGELKASLSLQLDDEYSAADALAWSPDGTRLAASGKNGVVMVFDTASGKKVGQLRGHVGAVGGLAFHPGGALLASGGEDGTVRLWAVGSGAPLVVLHGERGFVHGMTFSLDGTVLHTVSSSGTLRSWAGDPSVYRASNAMGHEASYAIAIDPSGTKLVSGNHDSRLRLFSLRDGETLYEFEVSDSPVIDVAYAPDGKRLAVCLQSGAGRIVDAGSGALAFDLGDELQTTTGLAWSHDGHFVALLDGDDTVAVFDARTGSQIVRSSPGPEVRNGAMGRPGFSPDDRVIIAPFATEARLLDPVTGVEILRLPGPGGRMSTTQFLPDGRRAAGLTQSGKLVVWDTQSGGTLWSADGHDGTAYRLAVSPDGRRIASGANELVLWDADSGLRLLTTRVHSTPLYDLAFSLDGVRLAWCSASGRLGVLDAVPLRDRLAARAP
jgi:WD40 repeat protein